LGEKTKEQLLFELMEIQKTLGKKVELHDHMIKRFQTLTSNEGLFSQIIDYCPYPIAVFTPQGTLIMANHALFKEAKLESKDLEAGKCNVFRQNSSNIQLHNAVKQIFTGKTFLLEGLEEPLSIFSGAKRDNKMSSENFDKAIVFPIFNDDGEISHGVIVFTI